LTVWYHKVEEKNEVTTQFLVDRQQSISFNCRSSDDREILYRTFRNLIMMNRDKIPYSIKRSTGKSPLTCPFNTKMEESADLRPRYND